MSVFLRKRWMPNVLRLRLPANDDRSVSPPSEMLWLARASNLETGSSIPLNY